MMALAMAFVGETVPKDRIGSAMGLLGAMSAIGTASRPIAGWRSDRRSRLAGNLPRQRSAWRAGFCNRRSLSAHRQPGAEEGGGRFRRRGYAAAGPDAGRLCACHDHRPRQFRPAQLGLAPGRRCRSRSLRVRRKESGIALDPIDDVPRPALERKPRHQRARYDSDDGDAGGRPVLPLPRTPSRCGPCRTRHVDWTRSSPP